MAVAVGACVGAKRGLFDDLDRDQVFATSPPSAKKLRHTVAPSHSSFQQFHHHYHSPIAAQPLRQQHPNIPHDGQLAQLRALFPEMDPQVVQETLESAGHNLEAAIKCLEGLRLNAANKQAQQQQAAEAQQAQAAAAQESAARAPEGEPAAAAAAAAGEGSSAEETLNLVTDTLVQEMAGATDLGDAHAKSQHILRQFEAEVTRRVTAAAAAENSGLKEHVAALARDNTILKRAVAIQNQRQQEHAQREQEMAQLQQTCMQQQEQLRHAQMHNYALSLHLRQAGAPPDLNSRNPDVC